MSPPPCSPAHLVLALFGVLSAIEATGWIMTSTLFILAAAACVGGLVLRHAEKLKVYARAQPAIYVDHTNQTTSIIKPTRGTNPLRQRLWEPPAGSCPRRRLLFEDADTRLGAAI